MSRIVIQNGALGQTGELLGPLPDSCLLVIVSDDRVEPLYGATVRQSLERAGYRTATFVFAHGEEHKNLDTYTQLLHFLAQNDCSRSDAVVALGGGVTGDLAGFAAATYMRGIYFIQLPTSLLACIDSCAGGKTGVNLPCGKNLAGAFHLPDLIVVDPTVLGTLPPEEFHNGMGEAVKYALLCGGEVYDILREDTLNAHRERFISLCLDYKNTLVAHDFRDSSERHLLNLGHTLGHCVEQLSGYTIAHGLCVALGIRMMAGICLRAGWLDRDGYRSVNALLDQYHMPADCPFSPAQMEQALRLDKKIHTGVLRAVTLHGIGDCRLTDIPLTQFKYVFNNW